ncbi:Lrp/AsnC family transcriptional regulator [Vibrio gigantis]|jgi:DNA-binding Lrp family transcriptional regulator|uniref:Leucine-responsive regulatory protein n=1 Tax=Vibrio chagasii TaxID=170679 RepID=A0A7V7TIF8_9VIBR|nr:MULTISPECIES: Lrp/AsnC family transcriptional regulator [Vibrio]KAB0483265.1 Lrp/AsnC family transcriptional regulator [Vibrio chagasii]MCG9560264.1 Lrp/AsnC family transcriptional regulator [Vibrio chagasii]ULN66761.1 Lrp/AsnC family transcriptional regulator [Vibrio gigantis]CAH7224616.1 Transcriptional regulator, AsnC family [Vibrio chagasii]|tara:strand:+ start:536 stop:976 length:441 start_codon:yes stop_codon:yes gene_type:complete|eukprot:TRINITY_DN5418_c0_g3_i1.p4 TRINITY_DN5418_c0_g3~~TRINITY_DN5418_c0_g3_i1.p4  ORF type:complete len:147 (+),score=0.79 TRINITY_DN5418_c0_g3_i1:2923-3363(+)
MDRFDERILQELKLDGRISNIELSERIGLSASATLRRVQDLERKGIIQGYRAVLDNGLMGVGFIAYVSIGLSSHKKSAQLEFEEHVAMEKEVVECHNITGANEYLLRVETKDLPSYKKFHADVLGECAQVQSITTMVVMDTPKDER